MHGLIALIRTPLAFVVVLAILVFVHEYGHYAAAKLLGFRIEAFAIGFGRAIASWTDRHGTIWQIGWLPLGGFVRLHGHVHPDQLPTEERAKLIPGQGFHDHTLGARALVTAAGPAANFLLAIVVFAVLALALGQPSFTSQIGEVAPGSAAARGGLRQGDTVLAIDATPVTTFADLQRIVVARPGAPLQLRIRRGADQLTLPVTPDRRTTGGRTIGVLGIGSGAVAYRPVGPLGAIRIGAVQTWDLVAQTAGGLWQILTGQRSAGELGGVIKIAQLSGQAAGLGVPTFINFIALLSVNLGLLNLFPIPVLDGGYLVLYALEALRGRPLPPRVQEYGFRVGLGLIVTLMVLVNGHNLLELPVFHWLAKVIF